ncbi:MAG TPA: hypothetical protein PKI48_09995 [Chitinophagales bacterium]|nr:hypothetical protein [Chitinophagales bacterium]
MKTLKQIAKSMFSDKCDCWDKLTEMQKKCIIKLENKSEIEKTLMMELVKQAISESKQYQKRRYP